MPDATSLHHCLQNHHQYCIILSLIRALNINRPVVNLAERGCKVYVISFLYSKCSTFEAWVFGQSYASLSHNPIMCIILNVHFAGGL